MGVLEVIFFKCNILPKLSLFLINPVYFHEMWVLIREISQGSHSAGSPQQTGRDFAWTERGSTLADSLRRLR